MLSSNARTQHIGLFRQMALGGVWPIMVANVHAMTADRLALKVQDITRA